MFMDSMLPNTQPPDTVIFAGGQGALPSFSPVPDSPTWSADTAPSATLRWPSPALVTRRGRLVHSEYVRHPLFSLCF